MSRKVIKLGLEGCSYGDVVEGVVQIRSADGTVLRLGIQSTVERDRRYLGEYACPGRSDELFAPPDGRVCRFEEPEPRTRSGHPVEVGSERIGEGRDCDELDLRAPDPRLQVPGSESARRSRARLPSALNERLSWPIRHLQEARPRPPEIKPPMPPHGHVRSRRPDVWARRVRRKTSAFGLTIYSVPVAGIFSAVLTAAGLATITRSTTAGALVLSVGALGLTWTLLAASRIARRFQ